MSRLFILITTLLFSSYTLSIYDEKTNSDTTDNNNSLYSISISTTPTEPCVWPPCDDW